MSSDFPNPGHNIDNFKVEAIIAIKFQILLLNFKTSKKIDTMRTYLFCIMS